MRLLTALTPLFPLTLAAATPIAVSPNVSFEPNVGQVAKSVNWVVRQGAGTPMFLRAAGAAIAQYHQGRAEFMEIHFDGARTDAVSTGESALASYSNYYLGRDEHSWFTGVPHFARVRYHDIYPRIDVVYHSNGSEIEYDFDVHPGADPSKIHISFRGIDSLRTDHGELIVTSQGRELHQRRPRVFQNGREIAASYRIVEEDSHVEIALADYDPTSALLIDPSIQFASYLGGPGNEFAEAIQLDSQGYIYIAGAVGSIVSPTLNPFTQSSVIVASPVIFKFTPDGQNLVFFLTLTVDNQTYAEGLAIDSSGNLMIAGETAALQLPLKNPVDSSFKAQVATAFATKWTADGRSIVYSTYFGGSGNEHAKAGAAVDAAGNLYFAGITSSLDLPVVNAFQPKFGGGTGVVAGAPGGIIWFSPGNPITPLDCYVTKLSPTGQIVFSTYLGGSDNDACFGLALAPDGGVVVGGSSGPHFPLANPVLTPNSGDTLPSPVVAKLSGDGQVLELSTFIASRSTPTQVSNAVPGAVNALAVDPSGNIYAGGTCLPGLATSQNAFLPTVPSTQGIGVYVIALNSSGQNILYSTYLDGYVSSIGGPDSTVTGLAVDAQGSAYVTGRTSDQNFPLQNPIQPYQGSNGTGTSFGNDWFLARLSPSGSSLLFSTFLGGDSDGQYVAGTTLPPPADLGATLTVAADGSIYFAGTTENPNIPTTNAFQPTYGGGSDIFFAKITGAAIQAGPPAAISAISGTPQTTGINAAFALRLQARVTDSADNPVSGVTVNFSPPTNGASATLSASSAVTDSSGSASITATANGTVGSYTVTATTPSLSGTASFSLANAIPNVTVQTSPPGIPFSLDGVSYTSAQSLYFPPTSVLTLSVIPTTPTGPGARAIFNSWSDGGSAFHPVMVPSTPITYTANFTQQYQLTTAVSPVGSGTVTPAAGTYYNAGSTVTLTAAPTGSLNLVSWTGPVTATGSLTGMVVMNAPVSVTANFGTVTQPASTITALLNSASYAAGPVAGNEFLAAFGTFPGCTTSNAQVTIGTTVATVLYASATQVNFLTPAVTTASAVKISCLGSTATPFPITIAAAAPGLFTVSQDGTGQIAVVNQDYSVNTPSPAGSYISVYGTGFGAYNSPSSDGLTRLALQPTGILTAGGKAPTYSVNVSFAGQSPGYSAGLQQINLQIPADVPAGVYQLLLTAGSTPNQSTTQASAILSIIGATASAAVKAQ